MRAARRGRADARAAERQRQEGEGKAGPSGRPDENAGLERLYVGNRVCRSRCPSGPAILSTLPQRVAASGSPPGPRLGRVKGALDEVLQPVDGVVAGLELRVVHDALVQRQRGLDAAAPRTRPARGAAGRSPRRGSARARSAWRPCCRNRAARRSRRTAPNRRARPGRPGAWNACTRPGVGMKVSGILGVDPALDRVAGEPDVRLRVAERLARRRCGSVRAPGRRRRPSR